MNNNLIISASILVHRRFCPTSEKDIKKYHNETLLSVKEFLIFYKTKSEVFKRQIKLNSLKSRPERHVDFNHYYLS